MTEYINSVSIFLGKFLGKSTRPFRYDLNQIPYNYTVEVTDRFKGLDLIDRVPEELRTEVCDIVQEAMGRTIPKKKKCKKAKWSSEEASQIAEKRREAKGKGEAEAEDTKERWQKYAEKLYKRDLNDPVKDDGVITHLQPDILDCKVKWALGSITKNKASGGNGIPVELFQILKDDAVKALHSICQQIWKTQQWPQDWERSVFIPIPKKGNAKECSNYHTVALISHASKVMLKILQARLQQYVNRELPNVQAAFRKGRGTRDQFANIH